MAYCRFGKDSDVYMYYHIGGYYDFMLSEPFKGTQYWQFEKPEEAKNFVIELYEAGIKFPYKHVLNRIKDDEKSERE